MATQLMFNLKPKIKMAYTTYDNPKLIEFFTKDVDAKDFAKSLRRATYLIALSYMRSDDVNNPMSKEWTDESYYFLNELAEILDPVLESE